MEEVLKITHFFDFCNGGYSETLEEILAWST